jgi:TldD protein
VDMVGKDFKFDIGTGYCGKFQPAKVDGGGPHIRCNAIIGGLQ